MQGGRRQHKESGNSLKVNVGTNNFLDTPCGLLKLKLKRQAVKTIVKFRGKRNKLQALWCGGVLEQEEVGL